MQSLNGDLTVKKAVILLALLSLLGCQDSPSAIPPTPQPSHQDLYGLLKKQDFPTALTQAKAVLQINPSDTYAQDVSDLAEIMAGTQSPTGLQNQITVSKDKFTGITYYSHKLPFLMRRISYYLFRNPYQHDPLNVYVASQNGIPHLFIEVSYEGAQWIFPNGIIVVTDTTRFEKDDLDFGYPSTTVLDDSVSSTQTCRWEATTDDVKMLKAIVSSSTAQLRICGRSDNRDFDLTVYDRRMIQDMLAEYATLGTQLSKDTQ